MWVTEQVLAAYQTILLAGGDIDFTRVSTSESGNTSPATELASALSLAPELKLLMQPYHADALRKAGGFAALNASGQVEVLDSPGTPFLPSIVTVTILISFANIYLKRLGFTVCVSIVSEKTRDLC